jgi:hypothetical protein
LNEVTLRLMLVLRIANNYYTYVANIQIVFLNVLLETELIWKDIEGYEEYLGDEIISKSN